MFGDTNWPEANFEEVVVPIIGGILVTLQGFLILFLVRLYFSPFAEPRHGNMIRMSTEVGHTGAPVLPGTMMSLVELQDVCYTRAYKHRGFELTENDISLLGNEKDGDINYVKDLAHFDADPRINFGTILAKKLSISSDFREKSSTMNTLNTTEKKLARSLWKRGATISYSQDAEAFVRQPLKRKNKESGRKKGMKGLEKLAREMSEGDESRNTSKGSKGRYNRSKGRASKRASKKTEKKATKNRSKINVKHSAKITKKKKKMEPEDIVYD
ncbi:unnamed protein product [Caenorhabditis bovis]|uniref:Uncharacterized protein n=1 Tax=Caenorhabditis bovis TaxID=2654633 RepID=A0A8S1EMK5_9PELO|nr:unnamed protein product [Caenorhabditis bovis]